jgi:prepilin-type N-terminal cleavage/methylation domain-containing protein
MRKVRSGFTLVELLVVVAIVALLAAMTLPGLSRAREYAYFTTCKGKLRQTGIGFLIFAADNSGSLSFIDAASKDYSECDGGIHSAKGWRRIGGYIRLTYHGTTINPVGGFIRQIYDDSSPGQTWEGKPHSHRVGKPRLPGRYLPIEIFWDPIVIVRDWNMRVYDVGYRAGTERGRDDNSRGKGNLGYSLFIYSMGCMAKNTDHIAPAQGGTGWGDGRGAEEPFRWAAKGSPAMHTSRQPSSWLAACIPPAVFWAYSHTYKSHVSHFGARSASLGTFNFNVVHMDGHVDDSLWKSWWQSGGGNSMWQDGGWGLPYGYQKTTPYGCEQTPEFKGAFDDNL